MGGAKRKKENDDEETIDKHAIPQFLGELPMDDGDGVKTKEALSTDFSDVNGWLGKLSLAEIKKLYDVVSKATKGMSDQGVRQFSHHHPAFQLVEASCVSILWPFILCFEC